MRGGESDGRGDFRLAMGGKVWYDNSTCRVRTSVVHRLPKPRRRVRFPYPAPKKERRRFAASQLVKERQFSLCESWRFSRIKEEIGQKNKEIRAAPLPEGQFFEIHSSIFKPHPC